MDSDVKRLIVDTVLATWAIAVLVTGICLADKFLIPLAINYFKG